MITGGAGYLGSYLAKQFLAMREEVSEVIVYSRDELKHFDLKISLELDERLQLMIGNVRDADRLHEAMKDVDIVIHAAAMKHVDICEANPSECVKTNIHGSENVLRAAKSAGVKKLILISTDKAVEPMSVYGDSKHVSERLTINANSETMITTVLRLGNLIGSSGSIVDKVRKVQNDFTFQLYASNATRFADGLPNALRLIQSSLGGGFSACVLIPKLKALRVIDLAYCLTDQVDATAKHERPFEKMHEKLLSSNESDRLLENEAFYIIPKSTMTSDEALERYRALPSLRKEYSSESVDIMSTAEIREMLSALVLQKV